MKKAFFIVAILYLYCGAKAQGNSADSSKTKEQMVVTKNDGTEYIGVILSDDGREVLIETNTLGKIYLPKSDIKSIKKVEKASQIVNGEYQSDGPFTTRYAFTTNALPIVKGENYSMVNLYGPEVHFAVTNNLNVGIMSTWIASPLVLALKYTFKKEESNVNFSLGTLMGTTGYLNSFKGYGGLHWLSMTLGGRKTNVTLSGGYAYFQSGQKNVHPDGYYATSTDLYYAPYVMKPLSQGPIFSLASIIRVGAKASFVFDSMIGAFSITKTEEKFVEDSPYSNTNGVYVPAIGHVEVSSRVVLNTALFLMPGMRFQQSENKAFQISLAGVGLYREGRSNSFPFPMCSWFRKF